MGTTHLKIYQIWVFLFPPQVSVLSHAHYNQASLGKLLHTPSPFPDSKHLCVSCSLCPPERLYRSTLPQAIYHKAHLPRPWPWQVILSSSHLIGGKMVSYCLISYSFNYEKGQLTFAFLLWRTDLFVPCVHFLWWKLMYESIIYEKYQLFVLKWVRTHLEQGKTNNYQVSM